jgi:ethanolamine ammonia-lyase small subunit
MARGKDKAKHTQLDNLPEPGLSALLNKLRAQTPARLLAGRSGAAYQTGTQMDLREAHAAARDAVRAELNLITDLGEDFVRMCNLLEISSPAATND